MTLFGKALALIYPEQCVLCESQVSEAGGLCSECWRETPFLTGHLCDSCGARLKGSGDGAVDHCDACISFPRPWMRGRAALGYAGAARRLVLGIKHADRTDLMAPAANWMARAGVDILDTKPLLVPIPIHRTRLIRRRYNQSAELVHLIAKTTGCDECTDALERPVATKKQDGMSIEDRFENVRASMRVPASRLNVVKDRDVCLVDDVMTSGATLNAASEALLEAGASQVSVLVLARVEKDT